MALADVRKAINMLRKVNVDVLGIVENMAGYTDGSGRRIDIFGSGGGEKIAQQFGVPLLSSIPIEPSLREGGDKGEPAASNENSNAGALFRDLALRLIDILDKKHSLEQPLRVIN